MSGTNVKSKVASTAGAAASSMGTGAGKGTTKLVAKGTRKVAGHLARRMLRSAARAATRGVKRAGGSGLQGLVERIHSLPIQQSIDVAVPVDVAWEQWLEFEHMPDGSHRVTDVERHGDRLRGHLEGPTSRDWEADVLDERECESFAWQSTEGSDSAGLVTFHELGERLTRIELNLDIRPLNPIEAAALTLRIADRRVESELRRFKQQVEVLNPDIYEELLSSDGQRGSD